MKLRVRIHLDDLRYPAEECAPPGSLAIGRVPRTGALMSSVAAHILVIVLVTVVSQRMALWFRADDVDWSRYRVEPLRLHLAEPLVFRASTPKKVPAPKPASPRRASVAAQQTRVGAPGSRRPLLPPSLELPTPPAIAKNAPVILQPDFHPQIVVPSALPPLAFWAPQSADLPKPPPPKQVVVPGRMEERPQELKLAARPVLAVPNREQAVAEVNISLPPTQVQKPPALPVANSATVPIGIRDAAETQAASFEVSSGQPVNVLALAAERRDLRDVRIPKGLQNIPDSTGDAGSAATVADDSPGAGAGANDTGPKGTNTTPGSAGHNPSAGSTGANPSGGSAGRGPSAGSTGMNPSAGSTPPAPASQSTSSAARGDAARSTPPGPASQSTSSPATGAAAANASPRPASRPGVTRVEHLANGNFDVVIMQSAARDDLPDLGGMLTGNPVYTVYLPVGDRKEWLLEYCAPAVGSPQSSPYEIDVDDAAPITPPYPISTTIPNGIAGQAIAEPIVLHGFLTAGGNLQNMKEPGPNHPLAVQILALLSEWQFRPAARNKKPIDVEILIVIPARS